MKKKIILAILVANFISFGAFSQVVNSWRDPNTSIQNPGLHRIVVGAVISDPAVRRTIEDYMVTLYPGVATQAYLVFGMEPLSKDEASYDQVLRNRGYDGIVLVQQTNENVTQHYVPGRLPGYYNTWGGYWRNGWDKPFAYPGTPGHIANDYTWFVQANVYSILQNRLIWSGTTRITDPGGRVPLFQDACNALRGQMRADGFLL